VPDELARRLFRMAVDGLRLADEPKPTEATAAIG
jgi:hypothetical protein